MKYSFGFFLILCSFADTVIFFTASVNVSCLTNDSNFELKSSSNVSNFNSSIVSCILLFISSFSSSSSFMSILLSLGDIMVNRVFTNPIGSLTLSHSKSSDNCLLFFSGSSSSLSILFFRVDSIG